MLACNENICMSYFQKKYCSVGGYHISKHLFFSHFSWYFHCKMDRFIYIIHNRALKEKRWIVRQGIQNDQASEEFSLWDLPLNMEILYPLFANTGVTQWQKSNICRIVATCARWSLRSPLSSDRNSGEVQDTLQDNATDCFGWMIHILISLFPTCSTPTVDYSPSAAVRSRSGYV